MMWNQIKRLRQLQLFQFQLSSMKYELLKLKNADILEIKCQIKKCTAPKSLRMCFWVFIGGQKKFDFFLKILVFLGHPLKKIFFSLYSTEFTYFLGY